MEPNLSRLTHRGATWRGGGLLVAVLMLVVCGFSWSDDGPPGPVNLKLKGPVLMAPGDSLAYTASWGAATKATGYKVSLAVAGTNGTWTSTGFAIASAPLPASVGPAPGLTFNFTAISTTADSATFTLCIESADAIGLTGKTACATWKVKRRAGAPGVPSIDSSRAVGTIILPNPWTMSVGTTRTMCAFKVFTTGAIAQWTADKAACDSIYQTYVPAAARLAVTAGQQRHTDSLGVTCVTWASSSVAVTVLPNGSCSAAVRVTGAGLTWRAPDLPTLEAIGRLAIAPEWMGVPITALW